MAYTPAVAATVAMVDDGNSSSTLLASLATFTGAWKDVSEYPSVVVAAKTDQAGWLYIDFSPDGVNQDSTLTYSIEAGANEVHKLTVTRKFFRIRIYNSSASAQTYLRVQSILGDQGPLITAANAAVQVDIDSQVVRTLSDPFLDISRGAIGGRGIVNKFGRNVNVGTTEVVIWRSSAAYTGFLTAAVAVRVKSGGNAADTSGGLGAATVTVEGLSSTFMQVSESITLAGASVSSATTQTFIRINRVYVTSVGTYSNGTNGANIGDVTIETTGGVQVAFLSATRGQTQIAVYTVPAGKTAYLMRLNVVVDGSKSATVRMYQRRNADDVSAPFSGGRRIVHAFDALLGEASKMFPVFPGFPEKTDIWVAATKDSSGTTSVGAQFDLVLVDD